MIYFLQCLLENQNEYNALIHDYSKLIQDFNLLIEQYNLLIDDLIRMENLLDTNEDKSNLLINEYALLIKRFEVFHNNMIQIDEMLKHRMLKILKCLQ